MNTSTDFQKKKNILPMLVTAPMQTYTKDNIMFAWRGSGLIPPNPRTVLMKLPTYLEKPKHPPPPPPVPPTPRNSKALLHKACQAKLLLKLTTSGSATCLSSKQQAELVNIIDSLKHFAIGADRGLQLERDTNKKWREAQKLSATIDRRELKAQNIGGKVMGGATLKFLYEERQRLDSKKAGRGGMARAPARPKSRKAKEVQCEVSEDESTPDHISILVSDTTDSGHELEDWEDDFNIDFDDSSIGSFITVATPGPRPSSNFPPVTPSTPVRKASTHPQALFPVTVSRYITRSRVNRR